MIFYRFLLIVALLISPAAYAKQLEVVGTLAGSVGERTNSIWTMLATDGQATATFEDIAGFTAVTLQAHQSAHITAKGSVTVSFSLMSNGAILEPNVLLVPGKSLSTFYEAVDGSIKIEIKTIERNGDLLTVEGTAKGQIFRTTRSGLKIEVDRDDAITVDITFDATAQKN